MVSPCSGSKATTSTLSWMRSGVATRNISRSGTPVQGTQCSPSLDGRREGALKVEVAQGLHCPRYPLRRIQPQLFRVLLFWHMRLPLSIVRRFCRWAPEARGGRRLEVVANRLPFFGGTQIAGPRAQGRRKERTCPELSMDGGRARLVVLAVEVGGRWSTETANFLVSSGQGPTSLHQEVRSGRSLLRCWPPSSAKSRGHPFGARRGT